REQRSSWLGKERQNNGAARAGAWAARWADYLVQRLLGGTPAAAQAETHAHHAEQEEARTSGDAGANRAHRTGRRRQTGDIRALVLATGNGHALAGRLRVAVADAAGALVAGRALLTVG